MSGLPVLIEGARLRVLVVGGGAVGARRAKSFTDSGAQVRVVAPALCAELEALVESRAVTVERRGYASSDIGDAQVVVAATNSAAVNAQVARDCDAHHRLLNAADFATEGNLAMMAAHRSGPLTVGVSAGGVPAAAARIRDAIAKRFDERYADALAALSAARARLLAAGESERWRAVSSDVIDEEFCDAVEQRTFAERLAAWR